MAIDDLLDAKVYVGTYRKYNEGSLFGKWLTLSDYSDVDDFYNACQQLHSNEDDVEFMFQDWENIPEGLIAESWISESVFDLLNNSSKMPNFGAFLSFISFTGYNWDDEELDYLLSKFSDSYQGCYESAEVFTEQLADDGCFGQISDFARSYIDYEKVANDLFITDYYFDSETNSVFNRNY